jgi:hypothetical protein
MRGRCVDTRRCSNEVYVDLDARLRNRCPLQLECGRDRQLARDFTLNKMHLKSSSTSTLEF